MEEGERVKKRLYVQYPFSLILSPKGERGLNGYWLKRVKAY
jgi:hypothetical protein